MTPGAGVQVAPGDPGALFAAAQWHTDLADGLSAHGHTVSGTAASVSATWNGEAAASYQALSAAVAAHFWHAAGVSRDAAAALHRYASELARLQLEGTQALHQAEHWLGEVNTWTARLRTATNEVTKAEAAVRTAQNVLNHATAAPHGNAVRAAVASLHTAQDALHRAQDAQRKAQHQLDDSQHQLTHWQKRGADLWHQAEAAASRATGELAPLNVAPPPLAGGPLSDLPGPTHPPATQDPLYQWLTKHPNKAVTDPNPRDHRCQPGQIFIPYFGCKDHPPKLPPSPPPPSSGNPGCAGGVNLPGLGCIQPPSLPSPPQLPPLPPLPPIPLPA